MDCANRTQRMFLNQDVVALKQKVINEFNFLLKRIRKGYRPDYEFILQEISFIGLLENQNLDNTDFIKQFYLNNVWQTQF